MVRYRKRLDSDEEMVGAEYLHQPELKNETESEPKFIRVYGRRRFYEQAGLR
jgi:hypothetical protein